jgi:hypothetical protein
MKKIASILAAVALSGCAATSIATKDGKPVTVYDYPILGRFESSKEDTSDFPDRAGACYSKVRAEIMPNHTAMFIPFNYPARNAYFAELKQKSELCLLSHGYTKFIEPAQ